MFKPCCKHRKVCTACKAPFLTAEKGTKRLPASAHKIQFYAARFTTRSLKQIKRFSRVKRIL
jgi:hypothetical protein